MLFRFFDIVLSTIGILLLFPVFLVIMLVGYLDTGSPLFRQQRVGKNKKPFTLIKFRTMNVDTKSVATHLADANAVTKMGAFLRRTKLDELPQLFNVILGHMSLVGPRPGLYNQKELLEERSAAGVFDVRPGITGYAQINEVDMSTPKKLAKYDAEMIRTLSVKTYFMYIFKTALGKGGGDRVKQ